MCAENLNSTENEKGPSPVDVLQSVMYGLYEPVTKGMALNLAGIRQLEKDDPGTVVEEDWGMKTGLGVDDLTRVDNVFEQNRVRGEEAEIEKFFPQLEGVTSNSQDFFISIQNLVERMGISMDGELDGEMQEGGIFAYYSHLLELQPDQLEL